MEESEDGFFKATGFPVLVDLRTGKRDFIHHYGMGFIEWPMDMEYPKGAQLQDAPLVVGTTNLCAFHALWNEANSFLNVVRDIISNMTLSYEDVLEAMRNQDVERAKRSAMRRARERKEKDNG